MHLRSSTLLKALISFCLFVGAISLPIKTRANFVGNDTSNFNPIPDGIDFVTVNSSEPLAPGYLNSGLFLNYAKNSLPPSTDINGNLLAINSGVTFSDFGIAYGIMRNLDFGVSLSTLLSQQVQQSQTGAQFAGTGLNEVRLASKYRLIERSPVGMALVGTVNINQSTNNPFAGQNAGPTLNLEGVVDYRWSDVLLALNLGYRWRHPGDPIPDALYQPLPNQIIGSIGASYYIPRASTKLIAEIFAAKPTQSVQFVSSSRIPSEFLIGLKYDASQNAAINLGAGSRITEGLFTPEWRVYIGLNLAFDLLKRHPVVVKKEVNEEINFNYYEGYQPEEIEQLKTVPFDVIAKTHEFQLRTTVPEHNFEGRKPPFEIIRLNSFDFDFGSTAIRKEYFPLLDRLEEYLASNPKVLKVRIEGHTDSIGSLQRNRVVSQGRADNLKAYLEKNGRLKSIDIEAVGFGSDRPIADNGNLQGRKQNRRVEFRILRRLTEKPASLKRSDSFN